MTTKFCESLFPFDETLEMSEMRHYKGPDRLRWIRDRQIAQALLDLWVEIQRRNQKRRRPTTDNLPHWNDGKEAAE